MIIKGLTFAPGCIDVGFATRWRFLQLYDNYPNSGENNEQQ